MDWTKSDRDDDELIPRDRRLVVVDLDLGRCYVPPKNVIIPYYKDPDINDIDEAIVHLMGCET